MTSRNNNGQTKTVIAALRDILLEGERRFHAQEQERRYPELMNELLLELKNFEHQFSTLSHEERRDPKFIRHEIRIWLRLIKNSPIGKHSSMVVDLLLEALDTADAGGSTFLFAPDHVQRNRRYGDWAETSIMGMTAAVLELGVSSGQPKIAFAEQLATILHNHGLSKRNLHKPGPYTESTLRRWLRECKAGTHPGALTYYALTKFFREMYVEPAEAIEILISACNSELGR